MVLNSTLRLRRSTLIGWIFLPLLLLCCVAYYFAFAANMNAYDGETGFFQLALNSHDHYVYLLNMDLLRGGDGFFELANDKGMALIYTFLSTLFPFFVNKDLTLISLIFNCSIIFCCYWIYANICDELNLGSLGKLSFFANLSFIYFAQLINKDALTILVFLLTVQCGIQGRLFPLLILLPVFLLVRQQLVVFVLIFAFLMSSERPWPRILLLYVATSLAAGLLSVFASIIGEDSLGEGFSAYLINFNQQYYVGYFLFNPLRVLQYILDAYASFFFGTETGGIDTAKLLRLPQLVVILLLLKPLSTLIIRFSYWLQTPARSLVLVVVAYLLTWLMNPTINARYVMLITPILVLFALYARGQQQKKGRA
jgi:hypothetical protein